jgi:hypothetical protein
MAWDGGPLLIQEAHTRSEPITLGPTRPVGDPTEGSGFVCLPRWNLLEQNSGSNGGYLCINFDRVISIFFLLITNVFSLDYQCFSSSLQYLAHSHIISILSSHKVFNFKFKKFINYSNECNKIILVNYNLPYFF